MIHYFSAKFELNVTKIYSKPGSILLWFQILNRFNPTLNPTSIQVQSYLEPNSKLGFYPTLNWALNRILFLTQLKTLINFALIPTLIRDKFFSKTGSTYSKTKSKTGSIPLWTFVIARAQLAFSSQPEVFGICWQGGILIISLKPFLPALDYFVLLSKMLLKTQPLPLPPLPAPPPLFSFLFLFLCAQEGAPARTHASNWEHAPHRGARRR